MKRFAWFLALVIVAGCSDDSSVSTISPSPSPTSLLTASPATQVDRTTSTENLRRVFQLKDLQQIPLTVGPAHLKIWIMDDYEKREEGMMWLNDREVKADEGMLFVFSAPHPVSFWMKNTLIPLDLIYLDSKRQILNIAKGKPMDESQVSSAGKAQYVIELKQGTAKRLGIHPGDKANIPDSIKSRDDAP